MATVFIVTKFSYADGLENKRKITIGTHPRVRHEDNGVRITIVLVFTAARC